MKFEVRILVGVVEGAGEREADIAAKKLLEALAGSNDGAEVLANAEPELGWIGS